MLPALALGALSFGGSLLQGMGAKKASAKQWRLQQMENARVDEMNQKRLADVNAARERLGRELLATPEKSYTANSSWVDVDAMMAAAERSGFNPVTWLNAGGMQAYTQTSQYNERTNPVDAFKMMLPEYALAQAGTVPQQHSSLSAVGGALSAGASAFGTQYRADMSYDLQMEKMALGGINMGMGLSNTNGLQTAYMQPGRGAIGGTNSVGGLSLRSSGGGKDKGDNYWPSYDAFSPQLWKTKEPESTNPLPPNWGWTIPPGFANTESYEDTFGEGISIPYGVWKLSQTALHNLTGATLPTGLGNWWNGRTWSGGLTPGRSGVGVTPYVPPGMSADTAYPSWARP